MTPINMTHHAPAADLPAARRALLRERAQADLSAATAARVALERLTCYANGLLTVAADEASDDATLRAIRDQARDLARCAEALTVGLP